MTDNDVVANDRERLAKERKRLAHDYFTHVYDRPLTAEDREHIIQFCKNPENYDSIIGVHPSAIAKGHTIARIKHIIPIFESGETEKQNKVEFDVGHYTRLDRTSFASPHLISIDNVENTPLVLQTQNEKNANGEKLDNETAPKGAPNEKPMETINGKPTGFIDTDGNSISNARSFSLSGLAATGVALFVGAKGLASRTVAIPKQNMLTQNVFM